MGKSSKKSLILGAIGLVMMLSLVTVIAACTGPAGPAGPAGLPGQTATSKCSDCHNDTTVLKAKQLQWAASIHATGGNFERNSANCAICHTSEGFVERVAKGSDKISGNVHNPTPQNCRTCHKIHTTFTKADFALRTEKPVTLMTTGDTFDMGEGNLCASCHQPRLVAPAAGSGDIKITSPYWGPHHSPVAAMFLGVGGYGKSTGTSAHYSVIKEGCPVCHMADAYGVQAGGHTMKMAYDYHGHEVDNVAGCKSCHSDIKDFDRNSVQTDVKALMKELKGLLVADGIMTENEHAVPGTYSAARAGALFNYLMAKEDKSFGVHNPPYTKTLLQNGIDALK